MAGNKRVKNTKVGLTLDVAKEKAKNKYGAKTLYMFLALAIFICIIALASNQYFNYFRLHHPSNLEFCNEINKSLINLTTRLNIIEEKVDNIKSRSSEANSEKEKLLLRAANKYHIVLFANQVWQKIVANVKYRDDLAKLKEFALPAFSKEIDIIEGAYEKTIIPNAKIIEELNATMHHDKAVNNSTGEENGWGAKVKGYLQNSFKLKKINDIPANQNNIKTSITQAIDSIDAQDYSKAYAVLNSIEPKDDKINFVISAIKARLDAYSAAKKIMDDSLEW